MALFTKLPYYPDNANTQYLGHCNRCGEFEALRRSLSLCAKCIKKLNELRKENEKQ